MAKKNEIVIPDEKAADEKAAPVENAQLARILDRLLAVQRPAVLANIRLLRKRRPGATPEQIITSLERQYLASVTTGGAAIGATAVVPGVGTGASIALSGAGAAGFLEASALFAQSVTEVHGIRLDDPERARALVLTMMLGSGGTDLVRQVASQATGGGAGLTQYWGSMVTKGMPSFLVGELGDRAKAMFARHFLAQQGAGIVGRAMPFGIGAAIGGVGNAMLGRRVVTSSREAFGPAPEHFSDHLVLAPSRSERKQALTAGAYEPLDLFVRDYGGEGEKIALLVHGLMADSRIWYALVPTLLEHGYRVIAPDLAGHGGSPRSRVYSPERWAADIRASVLQTPDLIIGHGLGGLVASRLVDEYLPEHVVYVDPLFGEPRGVASVIGRSQKPSPPTRKELLKQHPRWTPEQIDLDLANLDRWDPETAHGVDDRSVVHPPEVPLARSLVVRTEKNSPVGKAMSAKLTESGFPVETVPGNGLSVFRDDLSAFVRAITDWL
ncbi:alpha/beta fold hydrolase [Microbacteriaceae bacterium VKM Ac-2855]|nr:alpha/beta fold hydrolase [Microbacteriaceae bacterium VKM Ac-2855]